LINVWHSLPRSRYNYILPEWQSLALVPVPASIQAAASQRQQPHQHNIDPSKPLSLLENGQPHLLSICPLRVDHCHDTRNMYGEQLQ
jgi:hypothetical protein